MNPRNFDASKALMFYRFLFHILTKEEFKFLPSFIRVVSFGELSFFFKFCKLSFLQVVFCCRDTKVN